MGPALDDRRNISAVQRENKFLYGQSRAVMNITDRS